MKLVFHRFLQRDIAGVLGYYEAEGGRELADRFFLEFEKMLQSVSENPGRFHRLENDLRRANFPAFPYHVLFREKTGIIQILVLRHHKRHPDFGTQRR